jgi:cell division protein FtsW
MANPAHSHSNHGDYTLLGIAGVIIILGLFIVASASLVLSHNRFGEAYYYVSHQLLYGVGIGFLGFLIAWRIHYTFWKKCALPLLLLSMIVSLFVWVPHIGLTLKGASRWIQLGGLTFQPSEALKLSFVMYLSAWMEAKRKIISSFQGGLIPFILLTGLAGILLLLQPDVGTLGVLALTAMIMFYVGGGKLSHILLLLVIGILGLWLIIHLEPYRKDRLTVFLNPETDPQGIGYQINQALIAIGSGGIFGKGFGLSEQKFSYLPEAAGDSIFAIFGEEFGFVGSVALLVCFLLFFWRGIYIAGRAPDAFARNLAAGITLLICVQAFINIGAIVGLLPLTGIPLSFISYGSSALAINMAGVGILMNISKYMRTV